MASSFITLGPLYSAFISTYLLLFGECALAQQPKPVNGSIIYPLGDVNLEARPQLRWTCSEGHNEASAFVVDTRAGSPVFESSWAGITRRGDTCFGPKLGKLINPPLPKPAPCKGAGCINVGVPRYSGFEAGQFKITLSLRGPGVPKSVV